MEQNLARMADTIIRQAGVNWRPHTKGIKIPAIARQLLDAGAIGVTCAKLGEAEVMAEGGIHDILVANQVVGPTKISRLVNLRRRADVMVAVDNGQNVQDLDRAALGKGVRLRVLIEVDVGMKRAGVEPGEPVLRLAQSIAASEGLVFSGLMAWESPAIRIVDQEEKRRAIAKLLTQVTDSAQLCRDAGIPVDIVSCGGTGTYRFSAFHPGVTEIQAGGGIFCDLNYRRNFHVDHACALTVLATVTSRPAPDRIICDAGRKTVNTEAAMPEAIDVPNVSDICLSAEHGIVELSQPSERPRVADKIEFIVGYADVTVALHDVLYGIRDGVVETAWPIAGRGRLQ
jgi:D-serine deaminase-like pyridoxal phosphate-dependent protein